MTRQERERAVLDLYYNQRKSVREIAKEARISFRDIGAILNNANEDKEAQQGKEQHQDGTEKSQVQLSISTQAYKLFSDGKSPIEVAVALNVRESEVTRFYKEYWKLNQMHDLNIVYEELKGDIVPFLKLYRSAKAAGMSEEHVVNLLRIANDNLPALEHRYEGLEQEINSLEIRKLNSNKDLQDLRKRILNSRNALDSCNLTYRQQAEKLASLQSKKIALENLVNQFENNNEEYLKIHQTVKDKVGSTLSDGKGLLRLALYSLIESIRNEPVKYSSLIYYNNMYSTTDSSYMHEERKQQYVSSQDYFIEHYSVMLLNEAEKLYNKLVKDLVNEAIDDTAFGRGIALSSSPLLSSSADRQQQQQPSSSLRH
jgi:archaellum component FlaC